MEHSTGGADGVVEGKGAGERGRSGGRQKTNENGLIKKLPPV